MEIVSDSNTSDADNQIQPRDSLVNPLSGNSANKNLEDLILGLDDDLAIIKRRLTGQEKALEIVTITGAGGIGKSTLAKQAYDCLEIKQHFDIRAWVTISQDFRRRDVLLAALHCISKQTNIVYGKGHNKKGDDELLDNINEGSDSDLVNMLQKKLKDYDDSQLADLVQKNLKGRRYLVVIDDIWSTDAWDCIQGVFPNGNYGNRVLLTTREREVATYANPSTPHQMNLLSSDSSWKLLRNKVFGSKVDHLDPELEKIGDRIAEKCQGLPLTISVIAGHLSKIPKTVESWKAVAKTMSAIIARNPDNCLGVLGLSYHYLPEPLKCCFLSMGTAFPEDFEVEAWRLIQLWIAEDFIKPEKPKRLEEVAKDYLDDLISRNLIMVNKRRLTGETKTCGVHDRLHEFCLIEAKKTNFMHVVRRGFYSSSTAYETSDSSVQSFSFRTKAHLNMCHNATRSLYFFGEFITSPSPSPKSSIHFKLLKVLAIFRHDMFSSFPIEITNLVNLRYLAVASHGDPPESISKLRKLQTLIFTNLVGFANLPVKIWKLTDLRHIRVNRCSYLCSPSTAGLHKTKMSNLEEFSTLCFSSCTNEIFSAIPNLKRLSIRQTYSESLKCALRNTDHFLDMSILRKLQASKCFFYVHYRCSLRRYIFPTCLKRLTLKGSYLPWEELSSLVVLPNLEVLKLKNCKRDDQVWSLKDDEEFARIKLLLIGNTKLKRWEACSDCFPMLQSLVLKDCTELENIPEDFVNSCLLESIELYDCSTSAADSARSIAQEKQEMEGNDSLKVHVNKTRRS